MSSIAFTKASKIFFYVFFVLLALSVIATFYRYMILEDYTVFIVFDESGSPINSESE